MSTVEEQGSQVLTLTNAYSTLISQQYISTIEQQESTIQGQGSQLLNLTNSYSTLISQFNTFLLQQNPKN
jgi:hypothetical protein